MIALPLRMGHGFLDYLLELVRSRRLILELAKREFRGRYLGSGFGLAWAFIHPSIMMLLYWLVFQYGLKAGPVGDVPFVVWLLAGLVPWFHISDTVVMGSTVVMENRFLVKKVVFRVSLLPVVRLLSILPVHLFFVAIVIGICWAKGYPPTWYTLQIFYYLFAWLGLALGMTWLVSALVPFVRDLAQFVQVLLQIFFWVTPIVWQAEGVVPKDRLWILSINPFRYIVRGYRESLIDHISFTSHWASGTYYWLVTAAFLTVGGMVFLRLRMHFADVL